jgi:3'(2'), 5'-bisphosphate nucleotidase
MNYSDFIEPVVALAEDAGRAILKVYATDFNVESKDDASPLTQADLASQRVLMAGLEALSPALPIISEESGLAPFEERKRWERYWLIDPLDGTKEFVKRNGEFTVNVALIDDGRPILGVVHVPVTGVTYIGDPDLGAERRSADGSRESISVRPTSADPVRVVGSRSHRSPDTERYLDAIGETDMVPMGSSLKFCVVAEGKADIYPRFGPTSEWDTAAAQAVVEYAGGTVLTFDGKPLRYNTKDNILNPYFLVVGPADRDWVALLPDDG